MIIKLYSDFPVYKHIEEDDFVKQFSLTYTITQKLKRKQSTSIGALIKDTNINRNYCKEDLNSEYEYVLLEYSL